MGAGASELDGSSGTTEVGPPTVTAGCFTCQAHRRAAPCGLKRSANLARCFRSVKLRVCWARNRTGVRSPLWRRRDKLARGSRRCQLQIPRVRILRARPARWTSGRRSAARSASCPGGPGGSDRAGQVDRGHLGARLQAATVHVELARGQGPPGVAAGRHQAGRHGQIHCRQPGLQFARRSPIRWAAPVRAWRTTQPRLPQGRRRTAVGRRPSAASAAAAPCTSVVTSAASRRWASRSMRRLGVCGHDPLHLRRPPAGSSAAGSARRHGRRRSSSTGRRRTATSARH